MSLDLYEHQSSCVSEGLPAATEDLNNGRQLRQEGLSYRVQRLAWQLSGFYRKIAPVLEGDVIFSELFNDLKITAEMLQEHYTEDELLALFSVPEVKDIRSILPRLVARLETELEKEEGLRQISLLDQQGPEGLESFILYDKYKNLVRKEWLLYKTLYDEEDLRNMRFLFVGCGGMPMTAIGMAKSLQVQVDCCDIDFEASQIAKQMVQKLDLQDQMAVFHGNALDVNYSRYDIVIVANLAQPQQEILSRIASHDNVKALIIRRVNGPVSLMYSSLADTAIREAGFKIAATADPLDKKSVHQSVLLTRA